MAPLPQPYTPSTTPPPPTYPGFTHWTQPYYASSSNPKQWCQEAISLAALAPPNAHPTLLFYTSGPTSLHLAQVLTRTPPAQHPSVLASFLEPYYSRLPNYHAGHAHCVPAKILATAWTNDELAGYGSYCNFQVGLGEGDAHVRVMREGVPDRGVWFAGEHTSPLVALGTVTGAWWSGEEVGERMVDLYGLGKNRIVENGDGRGRG